MKHYDIWKILTGIVICGIAYYMAVMIDDIFIHDECKIEINCD